MDDKRPSSTTADQASRLRARLLQLADAEGIDPAGPSGPGAMVEPAARSDRGVSGPADGVGPAPSHTPRRRRTPLVAGPLIASTTEDRNVPGPSAVEAPGSGSAPPGNAADAVLDLDIEPWPLGGPEPDDRWTRTRRISTRSALAVAAAAVLVVTTVGLLISASRTSEPSSDRRALTAEDILDTAEVAGGDRPASGLRDRPRVPDLSVPGLTGAERAPALPRRGATTPINSVPGSRSSTTAPSAAGGRTAAGPTAAPGATTTTTSPSARPAPEADGSTTPTTLLRPRTPGSSTTTTVPSTTTTTTTTTQPAPSADVSTTQSHHEPQPHTAGLLIRTTTWTYTLDLRVANAGPSTAEDVTVTIRVTSGTVQVTNPPSGWACQQASSTEVRCRTAALAPGDAATLRATGSGTGSTATWSTSTSTPGSDPGNGSGSVS